MRFATLNPCENRFFFTNSTTCFGHKSEERVAILLDEARDVLGAAGPTVKCVVPLVYSQ